MKKPDKKLPQLPPKRLPPPPETERKPDPIKETDEQKNARVEQANKAIQAVCKQYHVAFHVPTLDISSGKLWPVIKLLALDLP